jgi:hypothetical protein
VYSDSAAETNNNPVPIIPEEFFKYLLPNIPSNRKPASGKKGISAMYEA